MPGGPVDRAEVRRLIAWFLQKFDEEVTGYLVNEKIIKRRAPAGNGGGPPDAAAIRAGRTNIRYHLAYIGWLVRTRDWLAGERLSLAAPLLATSATVGVFSSRPGSKSVASSQS